MSDTYEREKDAVIQTVLGYLRAIEAYGPTPEARTSAAILRNEAEELLTSAMCAYDGQQPEAAPTCGCSAICPMRPRTSANE